MEEYIKKLKFKAKNGKQIELKNNIFIAPMAGITDRAFRQINYEIGNVGLIFNEMVSAKAICYKDNKTLDMLKPFDGEEKIVRGMQLFGSDELDFKKAAEIISEDKDLKIDILDINMGCPAPKVVKTGSGCFLLKDLEKVRNIAKNVREVWPGILSFKIRIGIDEENVNALEVCKILEEEGADFITIHARTYEGMFNAPVNYDIVRKIKEKANIPIIFNGGIFKTEDIKKAIDETNADGVMLARGAFLNPFLLLEISNNLSEDESEKKEKLINIIKKHFSLNIKYLGEQKGAKEFRKNLIWYSKFFKESNKLRSEIASLVDEKSFNKFEEILNNLDFK